MNGNYTLPGIGRFVAAFAATNLGDVSPNTVGPKCIDTGLWQYENKSFCTDKCFRISSICFLWRFNLQDFLVTMKHRHVTGEMNCVLHLVLEKTCLRALK
jgi:hypothetical protein